MGGRTGRRKAREPASGATATYAGQPPWPGIWDGRDGCTCSWAWHTGHGRMEIKYVNALCRHHGRAGAWFGGQGAGGYE